HASSDFSATIDLGDGTPASAGNISLNPSTGGLAVSGGHTYAQFGWYTTSVTVTSPDGSVSDSATAKVDPAETYATGLSFSGAAEDDISATVATFGDAIRNTDPSMYSAVIDWGDGSDPSSGTI